MSTGRHQNTFAFRHNKNSKLTKKIAASPVSGLCAKCHEQILWRKQYRKYKPLTAPGRCAWCMNKTVRAAYHNVCDPCAADRKVCAKCLQPKGIVPPSKLSAEEEHAERQQLENGLQNLRERERRTLLRHIAKGGAPHTCSETCSSGPVPCKFGPRPKKDDDDWDFGDDDEDDEEEEEGEEDKFNSEGTGEDDCYDKDRPNAEDEDEDEDDELEVEEEGAGKTSGQKR